MSQAQTTRRNTLDVDALIVENQRLRGRIAELEGGDSEKVVMAERFRVALQHSQIVVFCTDTDVRYTWAYSTDPTVDNRDAIGRTNRELMSPAEAEPAEIIFRRVLATGQGERYQAPHTVWGKVSYRDVTIEPHRNATGEIIGLIGATTNVTEYVEKQIALEKSNQEFRRIADAIPNILWLCDANGQAEFHNRRFTEYTGMSAAAAAGSNWSEIFHPDDLPSVVQCWRVALQSGNRLEIRARIRAVNGDFHWHLCRGNPLRDAQGVIERWVGTNTDIHQLVLAEQQLESSKVQLSNVLAAAPIIVWGVDLKGTFTLSEGRGLAGLGLITGEVVGSSVFERYGDQPKVCDAVRRALGGEEFNVMLPVDNIVLDCRCAPTRDVHGNIVGASGVAHDITELTRAAETLRRANDLAEGLVHERTEALQTAIQRLEREDHLLRNLLILQERERQLLAYEIHDGLAQDIVGAKMMAEAASARIRDRHIDAAKLLDTADELLSRAAAEARRMISDLRPLIIDEQGIVAAIDFLIASINESSGQPLHLSFEHEVDFERLPSLLEGSLFRIVQEALANVKRHSRATEATIRLQQHGDRLQLSVVDNGIGFELQKVPKNHFGLEGIRRRSELFGGRAIITSWPGGGTQIHIELPIEHAIDAA